MAKWNPFDKNILNADPDEFAGAEDAGYGVPRDADSGSDLIPDSAQADADQEGASSPDAPDLSGSDSLDEAMPASADNGWTEADARDLPAPDFGQAPEEHDPAPDFGQAPEEDSLAPDFGQAPEENDPALDFDQAPEEHDPAPDFGQAPESMGGPGGPGGPDGPGFGPGHDFEDDEPKFDTQTGERLDNFL